MLKECKNIRDTIFIIININIVCISFPTNYDSPSLQTTILLPYKLRLMATLLNILFTPEILTSVSGD